MSFNLNAGKELITFLVGRWKRSMERREFGNDFSLLGYNNTLIEISIVDSEYTAEPGTFFLKWSFDDAPALSMHVIPESDLSATLRFVSNENSSFGSYIADLNIIKLHFESTHSATDIIYSIKNYDLMSVCIIDVAKNAEFNEIDSGIQTGNMCRL